MRGVSYSVCKMSFAKLKINENNAGEFFVRFFEAAEKKGEIKNDK